MNEDIEILPSEELAYWVSVMQSDGSLYNQGKGKKYLYLEVEVSPKSLPHVRKI